MSALASALTTIRRTPYQALSAILMVMVTFVVGYSLSLMMLGAQIVIQHFESQPQVIAFFELGVGQAQINKLSQEIALDPSVKEVKTVTQEDALELYQTENQEDQLLLELVTADILPASIEVSAYQVDDLAKITEKLQKLEGVEEVVYQKDVIEALSSWTKGIKLVGLITAGVLAFISFLTIMVLIGLKAATQKVAIGIMRVIGASRSYVKLPFIIEGVLYGLMGAVVGWIISTSLALYLTPWASEFLRGIISFPLPIELFAIQLGIGLVVGCLLGCLAGLVAVSRFMKS
ncbi:MAG: permease-like cell division protein FtsX [Patescibacteria group bacterium]|nr:permease-like cell division protein FtsX [Patescibacteria group bacterium]